MRRPLESQPGVVTGIELVDSRPRFGRGRESTSHEQFFVILHGTSLPRD